MALHTALHTAPPVLLALCGHWAFKTPFSMFWPSTGCRIVLRDDALEWGAGLLPQGPGPSRMGGGLSAGRMGKGAL